MSLSEDKKKVIDAILTIMSDKFLVERSLTGRTDYRAIDYRPPSWEFPTDIGTIYIRPRIMPSLTVSERIESIMAAEYYITLEDTVIANLQRKPFKNIELLFRASNQRERLFENILYTAASLLGGVKVTTKIG